MPRCRFVDPDVVRLYFVDVHRRELAQLQALPTPKDADEQTALTDAIEAAKASIAEAELDGHFVDVKKRLNAGESRQVFTRQIKAQALGDRAELDLEQVGISKIVVYVVGWSLTDSGGKPVPFSEAALNNIDPETFSEIKKSVEWHDEQVEADRSARKNSQGGESGSSAISPSPSSTAGPTPTLSS